MARAIVAELASLTKAVIAAFNPTANQTVASPHLRVIFKTSAPPPQLVPKGGDPLREIVVTDPAGNACPVVFQHKIAALNTKLPPSILARRGEKRSTSKNGSNPPAPAQSTPQQPSPDVNTDVTDTETRSACAQSIPPDDHAVADAPVEESHVNDDDNMELTQNQAAQVESQRVTDDVDMEGAREPTCDDPEESHVQFDDVEMSPPSSPVQAPNDELLQQSPLELQLVTGNRSAPATKRALSPSPRAGTPLFTSNRFSLLQEDDVELSLDDYTTTLCRDLFWRTRATPGFKSHEKRSRATRPRRPIVIEPRSS
ncbi:Aste57867_20485 [Aphanomyces stellatus]|uniref:Aste57867_20485 protein n=1 Tax=Aphanomyces stellatus TaxID=120398 RepID=A0A485LF32_9STRA|nr:hypothetical protein As57867_020419 [Aphanomyces stellatus]VFT97171.1 Aste57867_20485 [Aphanomyces stellatus]